MSKLDSGLVGLPNVGKSTIFNILSNSISAAVGNYAFCTIDSNYIELDVLDEKLLRAASLAKSKSIIPAKIGLFDIAGLVEGASKGEGKGNQFLSEIRNVSAILHVVRCFEDDLILRTIEDSTPLKDINIINQELTLADMQVLTNIIEKKQRKKTGLELEIAKSALSYIENHNSLNGFDMTDPDVNKILKSFNLLSTKPTLYLCNIGQNDPIEGNEMSKSVLDKFGSNNVVNISAKMEYELMEMDLSEIDKDEMRREFKLQKSALSTLTQKLYSILGMHSFFTIGPKEARAWTIEKKTNAQGAAGKIHSDFAKGFIKAAVISYEDFIKYEGDEQKCKELGLVHLEGKEYEVQTSDIIHFKFNV